MIERDELAAWLRLLGTPRIGRQTARQLLAAFGSPQAVVEAPLHTLRERAGSEPAAALKASDPAADARLELTWSWLHGAAEEARGAITLGDPAYPAALLQTSDPPLLLYAQGRIELLNADSIGIVGSRNPTPQGVANARAFAQHLSRAGLAVVSGLARGIDGAAHEGALEGPGSTVAVVGTGLDRVYPRAHLALAHRIAQHGLIISEYPIGTPPLAGNFPPRNRIIAGLSRGTLVVEAALQSGSLITARLATEAGREVFAIPGSIHSPQARGCHALIKQGAKLVDSAQDILEELRPILGTHRAPADAGARDEPAAPSAHQSLLEVMGFEPVSLEALIERTGCPAAELNARLLKLELGGHVVRMPGQRFQRMAHG